jgi:hypothetical protein
MMMKARAAPVGSERVNIIRQAIVQFERALMIDPQAPHAKNNIALAQQWLNIR